MYIVQEKMKRILQLEGEDRLQQAIFLFQEYVEAPEIEHDSHLDFVNTIISDRSVPSKEKKQFGELLNQWGDPRLSFPENDNYWVSIDDLNIEVGAFLVTIKEWKSFLENGYHNPENWSEEGWEWKNEERPSWWELADAADSKKYLFDNQPVVGVSFFEAEAYANFHNARLMEFSERERMIRGDKKRPYPWGAPFGHGNANTIEEGLDKPVAVGLYCNDSTPEGIFDLAGNVAEWTGDIADSKFVVHPGAWNMESAGSWAKASELYSPAARTGFLGFRLVRDRE